MSTRDIGIGMKKQKLESTGKRYGLIIGINDYEDDEIKNLRYAVQDAKAIYDVMVDQDCGVFDEVKTLYDEEADKRSILKALSYFKKTCKPEDTFWLYYAGHGAPYEDEFYLLSNDAEMDDIDSTSISPNDLNKRLEGIACERKLTILDCCHAGMLSESVSTRSAGYSSSEILNHYSGTGDVKLFASDSAEKAVELDDVGHGAFTYYLVEGLRGKADRTGKGVITLDAIWSYLDEKVKSAAREQNMSQSPVIFGRHNHDFAMTVNGNILDQQQSKIERIESIIGLRENMLTTDEGMTCLKVITGEIDNSSSKALLELLSNVNDYHTVINVIKMMVAGVQDSAPAVVEEVEQIENELDVRTSDYDEEPLAYETVDQIIKLYGSITNKLGPNSPENKGLQNQISRFIVAPEAILSELVPFIQKGWNIEGDIGSQKSLMETVVNCNNVAFVEFFDRLGIDVNGYNSEGDAYVMLAVKAEAYSCVDYMLTNHVNVRCVDRSGNTLLHWAVMNSDLMMAEKIISTSVGVNDSNYDGKTAYNLARERDDQLICDLLVKAGADVSVQINDAVLEKAIRDSFRYDREVNLSEDEPLTYEHLSKVTTLVVREQFEQYEVIELMVNLEQLYLRSLGIEDIGFVSKLGRLRDLDLRQNKIANISPLADLDQLRELNLSDNNISDISPLSVLECLEVVNLDNNQISDALPLSQIVSLRKIQMASNELTSMYGFGDIEDLEYLELASNQIRFIHSISDLRKLKYLQLSNNDISDINDLRDYSCKNTLEELLLGKCGISDVSPIEDFVNLKKLYVTDSDVDDIECLYRLRDLDVLYINGNQISDIGVVEYMDKLNHLAIRGNQITDIYVLKKLEHISFVDMAGNPIKDDYGNTRAMRYLKDKKCTIWGEPSWWRD